MNVIAVAGDSSGYVVPAASLLRKACDAGLFAIAVAFLIAALRLVLLAPKRPNRR